MKVSVYIPTRNRAKLLSRAIESVVKQTYRDIELIVADDGSTDDTEKVVKKYSSAISLKYILIDPPQGSCVARNRAIMESTGEFLTGLDDDDFFSCSSRIEHFVDAWHVRKFDKLVLFDAYIYVDDEKTEPVWRKERVSLKDLRFKNMIGNQIFAERHVFFEAGLFDESMPAWQDWDLWLRIAKCDYVFININRYSLTMDGGHGLRRISTEGDSHKIRQAMDKFLSKIAPATEVERLSVLRSALTYSAFRMNAQEVFLLLKFLKLSELKKYAQRRLVR